MTDGPGRRPDDSGRAARVRIHADSHDGSRQYIAGRDVNVHSTVLSDAAARPVTRAVWRALLIRGGMALIGFCGLLLFAGPDLGEAGDWSGVLGMLAGLVMLVLGLVVRRAGRETLDAAERRLAENVRAQVRREARIRSLGRPEPISVCWSSTQRPVQATPAAILGRKAHRPVRLRLHGDLTGIVAAFRQLPRRQLVVLGEPGAGKTVLAMLLVLGLLDDPRDGEPVPVLLPLSSWDPRTPLRDWIADRIALDHRSLTREQITRLLDSDRIMPVLDGLDELDELLHGAAIDAVDRDLGPMPLVVTCRSAEYETAVRSTGSFLRRAAVVELEPITAGEIADFLNEGRRDDDDRWDRVLAEIRAAPDGPLAAALSTPLMADLARTVYGRATTDPAALLHLRTSAAIEDHLLDAFVPTVYADARPDRARRWLSYLAGNMNRLGTRDLSWWQIRSPIVALPSTVIFSIGAWLYFGLWFPPADRIAWTLFVAVCVAACTIYGSRTWADNTERERTAIDPHGLLRRKRLNGAAWSALTGLAFGALSLWYTRGGVIEPAHSLALALAATAALTLAAGLSSAWGSFLICRLWLAMTGRLPLRLTRFIREAHTRGVLRQAGSVYQFRHARLQDRLGGHPPGPVADPNDGGFGLFDTRDKAFIAARLRLAGPLLAIVLAAVFGGIRNSTSALAYASGDRPRSEAYTVCGPEDTCGDVLQFVWTLPPRATRAVVFTVKSPTAFAVPEHLSGTVFIEGCPGATVALSLVETGDTALIGMPEKQAANITSMIRNLAPETTGIHLGIHRADDLPCSTELHWIMPSIGFDYSLKIRKDLTRGVAG